MEYRDIINEYEFLKKGKTRYVEDTKWEGSILFDKTTTIKKIDSFKKGAFEVLISRTIINDSVVKYFYTLHFFGEDEEGLFYKKSFDYNAGYKNSHGIFNKGIFLGMHDSFFFEGKPIKYQNLAYVKLEIRDLQFKKSPIQKLSVVNVTLQNQNGTIKTFSFQ